MTNKEGKSLPLSHLCRVRYKENSIRMPRVLAVFYFSPCTSVAKEVNISKPAVYARSISKNSKKRGGGERGTEMKMKRVSLCPPVISDTQKDPKNTQARPTLSLPVTEQAMILLEIAIQRLCSVRNLAMRARCTQTKIRNGKLEGGKKGAREEGKGKGNEQEQDS